MSKKTLYNPIITPKNLLVQAALLSEANLSTLTPLSANPKITSAFDAPVFSTSDFVFSRLSLLLYSVPTLTTQKNLLRPFI